MSTTTHDPYRPAHLAPRPPRTAIARVAALLAAWTLVFTATVFATGATAPAAGADELPPVRCTEDMACWNCRAMGNLVCGPVVEP